MRAQLQAIICLSHASNNAIKDAILGKSRPQIGQHCINQKPAYKQLKNKRNCKLAPAQLHAAQHKHRTATQKPSFILPPDHPVLAARAVFYFFNLKSFVMAVLICRYYVGTVVLSCWFVAPGVFVWASALGYVVTSSCALPIGEAS